MFTALLVSEFQKMHKHSNRKENYALLLVSPMEFKKREEIKETTENKTQKEGIKYTDKT